MGRDVIVSPARTVPVTTFPVELICRCGFEISRHPTKICLNFRGDRIRVPDVQSLRLPKDFTGTWPGGESVSVRKAYDRKEKGYGKS